MGRVDHEVDDEERVEGGRTERPACPVVSHLRQSRRPMAPTVFPIVEPLACPGGLVCNLCPLEEKALCSPCKKDSLRRQKASAQPGKEQSTLLVGHEVGQGNTD